MTPISEYDLSVIQARLAANRGEPPKRDRSRDEEQEAKLQAQVEQFLDNEGAWYHHDRDRRGDRPGVPDLPICWCGQFIVVELKSKGGKLRPKQLRAMAEIRKAGGRVFVARSLIEFCEKLTGGVNEENPL